MPRRERTVLYALLGLSFVLHAVSIAGSGSGSNAFARAAAWLVDLGPAERVILTPTDAADADEETKKKSADVVLRSQAGHLAWGDDATQRAYAIGVVNDSAIVGKLIQSEELTAEREELQRKLEEESGSFQRQMEAIEAEVSDLDPNDPANQPQIQEAFGRYQQVQAEFQEWQGKARQRGEALESRALREAYAQFVAAVDVVAARRGVDVVLRAIPADAPFATDASPGTVTASLRMRTAVLNPSDISLTDDVLSELDLPLD